MSLIATDLKNLMIADLSIITVTDGASGALNVLATTITDYINTNAEVSFAWNAILPATPFTVDPTTTASGTLTGISIALTPSLATTQVDGLAQLSSEIIAGVKLGSYNITDIGFITVPQLLTSAPTIDNLVISIDASTQADSMLKLAQDIIGYITGLIPTIPVLGSHGSYTAPAGTGGTVTAIT